jgi:hypothetical protein
VINEVLTASVPPEMDRIELFNPTADPVDIGGWFLTDDHSLAQKFRIPDNTTIPAGGFLIFTEADFNPANGPGTNRAFSLSSRGESVYLVSGDASTNLTGYSHGFSFDAAPNGVSFGRYVNSVSEEQFPSQRQTSFMAANSGPTIGPVIISEIHYHPAAGGDEFVEVKNITESAVNLFDPLHLENTWRLNGIDFALPPSITLPAGGALLFVATNPASFRARYSVPPDVLILGPYAGGLQNSGERLKLQRPDAPDTNGVAYITVDEVRYNDKFPWPPAADGSGPSLQRRDDSAYGNDPINWEAAGPTPGQPRSAADTDGDGLPDAWEVANGADRFGNDAGDDPDNDGASNLQEYLAGTDPQASQSRLKMEATISGPGSVFLQFAAASNRTYSVLYKNALDAPAWSKLDDMPAHGTNRVVVIEDFSDVAATRFYRVVTPAEP